MLRAARRCLRHVRKEPALAPKPASPASRAALAGGGGGSVVASVRVFSSRLGESQGLAAAETGSRRRGRDSRLDDRRRNERALQIGHPIGFGRGAGLRRAVQRAQRIGVGGHVGLRHRRVERRVGQRVATARGGKAEQLIERARRGRRNAQAGDQWRWRRSTEVEPKGIAPRRRAGRGAVLRLGRERIPVHRDSARLAAPASSRRVAPRCSTEPAGRPMARRAIALPAPARAAWRTGRSARQGQRRPA